MIPYDDYDRWSTENAPDGWANLPMTEQDRLNMIDEEQRLIFRDRYL